MSQRCWGQDGDPDPGPRPAQPDLPTAHSLLHRPWKAPPSFILQVVEACVRLTQMELLTFPAFDLQKAT